MSSIDCKKFQDIKIYVSFEYVEEVWVLKIGMVTRKNFKGG